MYEDRFGTDWQQLSVEEAIQRMYALGAAARLGGRLPEERDRIVGAARRSYTEKILELAYEEGKQRAGGRAADDAQSAFQEVVEETPSVLEPGAASEVDGTSAAGGGGASADGAGGSEESKEASGPPDKFGIPPLLEEESEDLDRLDSPEFLRDEE